MKVYLPKGFDASAFNLREWQAKVATATNSFHGQQRPLRPSFSTEQYKSMLQKSEYRKYATPMWLEHYDRAEQRLLKNDDSLVKDDLLRYAFFLTAGGIWQDIQVPYLEEHWNQTTLRKLLIEDHVFEPDITCPQYNSSETLINHLTHLTMFQEKTGASLNNINTVIDFGGGYGSLCRLFRRIRPDQTYVIIDLPVFLFIQDCYLKNIFGKDCTNIILADSDRIHEGKINLVDVSNKTMLDHLENLSPDLFVATWSLSEANRFTQKCIFDKIYFSAKHLLVGYRHYENPNPRQPCSDSIELTPNYKPIFDEPTFFSMAQEQYYLFAKREE